MPAGFAISGHAALAYLDSVAILSLLALLLQAGTSPGSSACTVDRTTLLALDQRAFDQDLNGGWRRVAALPGCEGVAADLIRDYRNLHRASEPILFWHEGQLRAELGQAEEAIRLFDQARHGPNEFGLDDGWNHYVDASIAFLRRDMQALLTARARLAAVAPPPVRRPANPQRSPVLRPLRWPPNLDVVDGLIACFRASYRVAYSMPCRDRANSTSVNPTSEDTAENPEDC